MPRNVEIKARVADFAPVVSALGALGAATPFELSQEDTFFRCAHGRLKLRKLSATSGELIAYDRPDATGPKESAYRRVPTAEPDRLRAALAAALGTTGVVRKRRRVYLVGRTRVHLDEVDGLGRFIELEVVLDDAEPHGAGVEEARLLMTQLGIRDHQLVAGAYVDLLGAAADDRGRHVETGPVAADAYARAIGLSEDPAAREFLDRQRGGAAGPVTTPGGT